MSNQNVRRKSGFTLPEILVAVAMVGVLSAAVLPTVVGQISKSEISRIVQELQSVGGATQVFRADTGRWPGQIQHLVNGITTASTSSDGAGVFTAAEVGQWKGPYLAETSATASGLPTAAGAVIEDAMFKGIPGGTTESFIEIQISGLDAATAEAVSLEIDGGSETSWYTEGQIQWASGTTEILSYYPYPFK